MATDPVTIPPVRETLQSHGEAPLQTSSLYLHRSKHTREDGVEQNVIAGVHLVVKAGHQNNLYDAFNVPRTQKLDPTKLPARRAILIACDTLEIYGELGDPRRSCWVLQAIGVPLFGRDDLRAAEVVFQNSLDVATRAGYEPGRAAAMQSLGVIRWHRGDRGGAEELLTESLRLFRTLGESSELAPAMLDVGEFLVPEPRRK